MAESDSNHLYRGRQHKIAFVSYRSLTKPNYTNRQASIFIYSLRREPLKRTSDFSPFYNGPVRIGMRTVRLPPKKQRP